MKFEAPLAGHLGESPHPPVDAWIGNVGAGIRVQFRGCQRFADPDHVRLRQSRSAIERQLAAAKETFEVVLARTAISMALRAKSLALLDRPVYRPPLIARPLEPTTGKRPLDGDSGG